VAYGWFAPDPHLQGTWTWELRAISFNGANDRTIYHSHEVGWVHPTDWSPDGSQIVMAVAGKDRANGIALVSVATGAARVVKTLDWRTPTRMTFSPDGRFIAYSKRTGEDSPGEDILLLATDGSREIPLVTHPADDVVIDWVPGGNRLLFSSDRTGTVDAWTVAIGPAGQPGALELVKRDLGRIQPLRFTRAGTLFYGLVTGMQDVFVAAVDFAAGRVLSPPARATERTVGANSQPRWSPDGRILALVSGQTRSVGGGLVTPGTGAIVLRSMAEDREERVLNPGLRTLYQPCWMPNGRALTVKAYDDTRRRAGLWAIDVATGTPSLLVAGDGLYGPAWSPDGTTLFYRRTDDEGSRIAAYRMETDAEVELYTGLTRNITPSPDGRSLAFTAATEKGPVVKVMALVGRTTRDVLAGVAMSGLAWSPDGRHLIYSSADQLWRVPAEGGEPQKVGLGMTGLREISVHPDGVQVAFTAGEPAAEVWVLEHLLVPANTTAGPGARRP
jgi:Tol biopolymer transport system component